MPNRNITVERPARLIEVPSGFFDIGKIEETCILPQPENVPRPSRRRNRITTEAPRANTILNIVQLGRYSSSFAIVKVEGLQCSLGLISQEHENIWLHNHEIEELYKLLHQKYGDENGLE